MGASLPPLAAASAVPSVLLLLFAGHLLGDFGLQAGWMVRGKRRPTVLGSHVLVVTATHVLILLPHLGWAVATACVAIGVFHAVIDGMKAWWPLRKPGFLGLFFLDQLAHGIVLVGVFWVLREWSAPFATHLSPEWLRGWQTAAVLLAALAFTANGGAAIVSGVLATLSPELEEAEEASSGLRGSGRLIGILERTITLVLIVLGQWAAIVLLLAAKSIARFEELKDRRFAEYYLVGTLTSILVAIVVGLGLLLVFFGTVPSGPA
ncbi:MAG: DUF3307 domain-containing protein [Longimicrobiales bacterium]|nr:DUF3307 domain-containing protein [Longimicrobiales bacterium]